MDDDKQYVPDEDREHPVFLEWKELSMEAPGEPAWTLGDGDEDYTSIYLWYNEEGKLEYCWNYGSYAIEVGRVRPTPEEFALYSLKYEREEV